MPMRGGPGAVSIAELSMIERVVGWGPAALWAAVLFLLSAWDSPGVVFDSGMDKVAHGAAYLVLGLSLAWGRARTGSGLPVVLLILIGAGYGGLVEWYQALVPSRTVEWLDGVANALGVVVGYGLFTRFVPYPLMNGRAPDEGT